MNIDVIGKFYLGAGGIGDALLMLSTFYDEVEEANVIFLANNPDSITELFSYFPKLQKKFIIKNDWTFLHEFYHHPNCIGTGVLPRYLNYANWYEVRIFDDFKVKEFPSFVNLFEPYRVAEKQLVLQLHGSQIEGLNKQRSITSETHQKILSEFKEYQIEQIPIYNQKFSLKDIFCKIRGSDLVIGVDSFAKTFSAMSGIKTIVYDSIYSGDYLNNFKDRIDYGHYVFLFPWSKIELRKQK